MYLRLHTRYQRNSNGYTHVFWVQLSNWTRAENRAPEPEVEKMASSELQIRICTVVLVDQNLVIIWVSLPVNKSNILAFAEHFVLPTSGLVAHHSHKFQWNTAPQNRRYSRWNFVDILSESAETRNRS